MQPQEPLPLVWAVRLQAVWGEEQVDRDGLGVSDPTSFTNIVDLFLIMLWSPWWFVSWLMLIVQFHASPRLPD